MDSSLSFAQRRLWFLARLMGASRNYNVSTTLELKGPIDATALAQALLDVVARHETLRTVFPEVDGEPVQRILPAAEVPVELDVVEAGGADLAEALATDGRYEFDLTTEIPIRARLHVLGPEAAVLSIVIHHIACDGWSMGPFLRDLSSSYGARRAGHPPALADLPVTYGDYTAWQREVLGSEDDPDSLVQQQLKYWNQALADLPQGTQLPFDRVRPPVASYRGRTLVFELSPEVHGRLYELATRTRSSLFMVAQAAIVAVLTRLGAGTDIALGTAVSGRTDEALEDLVGFFVNTLVLRTDTSGNPTFEELIDRVREADLSAFDHQDIPFDRVVEEINPTRSADDNPLFQVMYSFHGSDTGAVPVKVGNLSAVLREVPPAHARFDLAVVVIETAPGTKDGPGLRGLIEYAPNLFDRATVEALGTRLTRFLEAACLDPGRPIADLPVFSPAELRRVTQDWNGSVRPAPDATLPDLFRRQVTRAPDATAVVGATGTELTYAQLDAESDALAAQLAELGVGAGWSVAVYLDRSVELVTVLLALLKSGATYVPLHTDHPAERIEWILRDAGVSVLLVDETTRDVAVEHHAVVLDVAELTRQARARDVAFVAPAPPRQAPAYAMYTSGSTGIPKGVVATHANLASLVSDRCWAMGPGEKILLHSTYAFDISLHEIWVPLASGATIVVAPPGRLSAADYEHVLAAHGVSCLTVPAGLFGILADEAPECFAGLRQVWAGGDVVLPKSVTALAERYPDLEIHHLYGPTETTLGVVTAIVNDYGRDGRTLPLGRPMDSATVYVLDDQLRPVGPGCPGEMYVGGSQVTLGYLNQPGRTAERFIASPFGAGERLYRTGDVGRWRSDGMLQFDGRVDAQVKIRGFRVEPAEVEAAIAHAVGVGQVVVTAHEDRTGMKRLVAYAVEELDPTTIRKRLGSTLPDYMIPTAFVTLDKFPLTPNGKLDRSRLPVPSDGTAGDDQAASPREQFYCDLFAEVLGLPRVGVHDNFFELGGHSLLATQLVSRIRAVLGREVPLAAFFRTPTPRGLATSEDGTDVDSGLQPVLTLRPASSEGVPPLFCIHPATGSSWCYLNLLPHLPPAQPVYGLQSPRLADPGYRIESVEQLAADYLERIREVQPHGPYRLLGWSFGGVVAFCMAALLAEQQEQVEFLALLDASVGELRGSRYLAEEEEPAVGDEQVLRELVAEHRRVGERYRPAHFPGDALVLVATADQDGDEADTGWRDHVGGDLREVPVDTRHHSMLRPE
ncbi:MAG TPA: amino acid adenylation domain-containing protein, partial [Jatrophihabitans sp.]